MAEEKTKYKAAPDAWLPREDGEMPLSGVRVLELASIIAGGFAGMLMGDFGADIIKIEHPSGDPYRHLGNKRDGMALDWKRLARNKRLVVLDLHDADVQQIVRDLAAEADVVTENFRPGTMEKWGLGYERLSERNPGLVMLRVTGWGQTGPQKDRPGFGSVAEAMAGFAAINGEKGGAPLLPPFGLADYITGIYGAFATTAALRERERSGKGQVIDLAFYESIFSILGSMVIGYDQLGFVQKRNGNRVHYSSPRNVYETADGRWVALSGSTPSTARRVFAAIDQPELADDPRFDSNTARLANADELDRMIADWMRAHTFEEVMAAFTRHEVPLAPVQDMSHIMKDAHFLARETIVSVQDEDWGTLRMPGVLPRMSRTPGKIRWTGGKEIGKHQGQVVIPVTDEEKL